MPRDKNRQFAPRTDTKVVGTLKDIRNGSRYLVREDDSVVPKQTTIALNQPAKFLLRKLKEIGGYANYSELVLELIAELFVANSLPRAELNDANKASIKKLMDRAANATEMQSRARKKAIAKGRYSKKRKGVVLDEDVVYEEYDPRIDIIETKKRKSKKKKEIRVLDSKTARKYANQSKRIRARKER